MLCPQTSQGHFWLFLSIKSFNWVSLTFSFTLFQVTECDILCWHLLWLHYFLPGCIAELKLLWVAVNIGLDSCDVKERCSVQEGAVGWEWRRSWGKAALRPASTRPWRLLHSAASDTSLWQQPWCWASVHFVPSACTPSSGSGVCCPDVSVPALWLWKQSRATEPNPGLIKMNICAQLYLNFLKALFTLRIFENSTSLKRTNLLLCESWGWF